MDRAIYLVNDQTRTYRFLRRNLDWRSLDPTVDDCRKRQIDGYSRLFRDGRRKVFRLRS